MSTKQTLYALIITISLFSCNNNNRNSGDTSQGSYQEKVQSVEEIERTQPMNFLTVHGTYNSTVFGNKFKIQGVVKNTATIATYKDVEIKVIFYSKTKTELGSNNYIIYEYFSPHKGTIFELKVDKVDGADSIGLDIVSAKAS